VQLLDDAVRDRVRLKITPDGEVDACLMAETTFGLGFMVHGLFTPYSGPGCYGHPGAGGSVAFADPARDLAFAYAMNRMATNLAGDTRAQRLIDAAVAAAGT
jgi:CubicO group peptidase (beta-lactamase class C family)